MVEDTFGKWLYDAGWGQGVLLPALPWSVIYNVNDPLNNIARAKQKGNSADQRKSELNPTSKVSPPYEIASGVTREKDYLVIITQDCDIVKDPLQIHCVFAMRAFMTKNVQILRIANGNSTQYFLLDEKRGLIADSTVIVPIEKPVLMSFTPQMGTSNDNIKRQFAKWVAHCFNRPAFPDEVVKAVIAPFLNNLHEMQKNGDLELNVLNMVKEVRVAQLTGDPPYQVSMIFITPKTGLPDKGLALGRFVGRISRWWNPAEAVLNTWDAFNLYEISAGDYIDTQQIYLDHYTYHGNTIIGLVPPLYSL